MGYNTKRAAYLAAREHQRKSAAWSDRVVAVDSENVSSNRVIR
jgi:hypothetical protein